MCNFATADAIVDKQVGVPKVKVRVENSSITGDANSILLDPIDFLRGFSVLKDELVRSTDLSVATPSAVVGAHKL